jgi:formiminoglutamase
MNLAIFFDPVSEDLFSPNAPMSSWEKSITIFREKFPSLENIDIAFVGLTEERGAVDNAGVCKAADVIRKKLYGLTKGTGLYRVTDLGNLRNGNTYEDTISRVKEVCEILLEKNIIPLLIGGSQDLTVGQYYGYEAGEKSITLLNLDSRLDMDNEESLSSCSFLNTIFSHDPNYLFHYSHLGYQTFLTEKEKLDALEKLYFELYRLGQVRDNFMETEPVVRTADMISFDITAIRMSDAPGNKKATPFGFTAEEACQLCWYAGINSRMTSLGIYEYNPEVDEREKTASVIATMIWYFIEGFYNRSKEPDVSDKRFVKYMVALKEEPHSLIFFKDTLTDKWWMEISARENNKGIKASCLIPCSYKDYQDANEGEIPNRWILTNAKLA